DWRNDMRGFADQHDSISRELPRPLDHKRKQIATGFDLYASEDRMGLLLGRFRQLLVAECDQPLSLPGARDPNHAAAIAGQRHEHTRTLGRVKLGRDIPVRPRMADTEGDGALPEFAARHVDAGCRAAEGMPAICANDKARGNLRSAAGANGN